MPKYPKTTKVEHWRDGKGWQDEAGGWHAGRPSQIATYWGNFKGNDYALLYQTQGVWAKPTFTVTIERPRTNAPRLDDHIRHDGKFYVVKSINDLTGQVGRDMKLICELDEEYHH